MSDEQTVDLNTVALNSPCDAFNELLANDLLVNERSNPGGHEWADHLAHCPQCLKQWHAQTALTAAFSAKPVPELSPSFAAGLNRKLAESRPAATERDVVPLEGWRLAAMLAYVAATAVVLLWALRDVQVPTIALSSPWTNLVILAIVPLTFRLALAVSRWLPVKNPSTDIRSFSF